MNGGMTRLVAVLEDKEKFDWITKMVNDGKTVYFQTPLRTTVFKKKHLPMLSSKPGADGEHVYINGVDYTYAKLTAR